MLSDSFSSCIPLKRLFQWLNLSQWLSMDSFVSYFVFSFFRRYGCKQASNPSAEKLMIAESKKRFLGHSHFIRHAIHGAIYDKIRKPILVIEPNLSLLFFDTLFQGVFPLHPCFEKNYFQMIRPQLIYIITWMRLQVRIYTTKIYRSFWM